MIRYILVIILLILASICDLKTKKIPNVLFYMGLIIIFLFDMVIYPISVKSLVINLIGMFAIFFIGSLRLFGMGDIKMWIVLSGSLGFFNSCWIMVLSSFLLILVNFIKNPKEIMRLFHLTIFQLLNEKKISIVEQKSYAFAPYITFSAIFIILLIVTNKIPIH